MWGIKEPSRSLSSTEALVEGNDEVDVIIVPGVAFDAQFNRLGHGKGYYGTC